MRDLLTLLHRHAFMACIRKPLPLLFCSSFNDRVTFFKIATKSWTALNRALFAPSTNYSTTNTGHWRSRHVPARANEPFQDKKSESTFPFQCPTPPLPPNLIKSIAFWKVSRLRPFVLLIKETCRWRWVGNIGGMVLTGENSRNLWNNVLQCHFVETTSYRVTLSKQRLTEPLCRNNVLQCHFVETTSYRATLSKQRLTEPLCRNNVLQSHFAETTSYSATLSKRLTVPLCRNNVL